MALPPLRWYGSWQTSRSQQSSRHRAAVRSVPVPSVCLFPFAWLDLPGHPSPLFSGGVVDFPSAKFVYEQTGVDGFLIGRGLWAKAWKLKELREHSLGRSFEVDKKTILHCALSHLEGMLQYYGDKGLHCFRKHLPFYIKGMESAGQLRKQLCLSESVQEVKEGLQNFLR